MRWINQESEFREILLRARTGVYLDSGRIPTPLRKLLFDDAEIRTLAFGNFLQELMELSADSKAHYIVLNPDPVYYFYDHFNKYPVLEIHSNDVSENYIDGLNQALDHSPADAIGINWWECVIVPPSLKWFVHALRSDRDDSGHLWVPPEYLDRIHEVYPYAKKTGGCGPQKLRRENDFK